MKLLTLIIVVLAVALVIYNNIFSFLEFAGKDLWVWLAYLLVIGGLLFYLNINKEHFKRLLK